MNVRRVYQRCVISLLGAVSFTALRAAPLEAQRTVADTKSLDAVRNTEVLARPLTMQFDGVTLSAAVEAIGRRAGVRVQYRSDLLDAMGRRASLKADHMPLGMAFQQILRGTGWHAVVLEPDLVEIALGDAAAVSADGVITGIVRDIGTKRPLRGAKVGLDGVDRTETADDGTYRITGVSAGMHTIAVKLIGYTKVSRAVTMQDGATTALEVALETSATALEQIVVTGTIIPTELKAVPNAITVITAKDIEQRGITHIDQLFRGDVPGMFAQNRGSVAPLGEVRMFSRGATALATITPGVNNQLTNAIKTYVDGVEMADGQYLSQLDPTSIERIEILTGPQASTIYGSNAINGVMQIFTKRGMSNTPQLTLNFLSGWIQNNFRSTLTPQHNYSTQLTGIEGRLNYNAGGSWEYTGPWTPAMQTARTSAFVGTRLELPTPFGRVTTDLSLRRNTTQTVQRGLQDQTSTAYRETGWYSWQAVTFVSPPTTYTLSGQTMGVTVGYTPFSWWSHELGVGQDGEDTDTRVMTPGYTYAGDTLLSLAQNHTDRRSAHYTTTLRIPMTSLIHATVTGGGDGWQSLTGSLSFYPVALTGLLANLNYDLVQPGHNTGAFLQTQLSVADQLFFTYGLRAEWNPTFGAAANPNYVPRYGVAYTRDIGAVTAKLRASYGRSTRPPAPGLQSAQTAVDWFGVTTFTYNILPYYGNFVARYANPDLGPESQRGGEGGLELYLGTRGSLVVTRYNQTVNNLIDSYNVDSVRTSVPNVSNVTYYESRDADGYGYYYQREYLNVASIRNQGWELQGTINTGPFTTKGTYSWTKSRTIGVTPKYRLQFPANSYPQYQPGATFRYLPEHTWAVGTTYVRAQTTFGLNVAGIGQARDSHDELYDQYLYGGVRLVNNKLRINGNQYISFGKAYTLADLTASHRLSSRVEGRLEVHNMMNWYQNDVDASYAAMGRQSNFGLRIRL